MKPEELFSTDTETYMVHFDIDKTIASWIKPPISVAPSIRDWFIKTHDLTRYNGNTLLGGLHLSGRVASYTRRGPGNILFVPTETMRQEIIDQHNGHHRLFDQIIVSDMLESNEMWCTYWKMNNQTLDGGVQYSPNGFSCLPNFKNYFHRGFI